MEIKKLIEESSCLILNSKTKTEAILEVIDIVDRSGNCGDIENLKKEIFYREQIMSTGIGQSIGIPHVRIDGIKKPAVYIGVSHNGIEDYESLDNQIVKIVVMILVGTNQHKEYLRILSLMVKKIKNSTFQERLINCQSSKEISDLIKEEEF